MTLFCGFAGPPKNCWSLPFSSSVFGGNLSTGQASAGSKKSGITMCAFSFSARMSAPCCVCGLNLDVRVGVRVSSVEWKEDGAYPKISYTQTSARLPLGDGWPVT